MLLQTRAELDAAEVSVAALTADKATLQQELSSSRDKVMLLESELKLKTSRMEAAQQQLASEAQEHQAKQALLQKQLEQYKVGNDLESCCNGRWLSKAQCIALHSTQSRVAGPAVGCKPVR